MSEQDGVPQLDANEAKQVITAGAFLLDVREPDEWQAGHAPEAHHVPMAEVPESIGELPSSDIVVVCRSGGRSQRVAAFLMAQGYSASNLAGGMQAWAAGGFTVVADDGRQGAVI
jgi:rhodanese-related sulfurtransferase